MLHFELETHLDTIEKWEKENKLYVSTKACKEVEKLLESQYLVVVTGHARSGKSAIIQHIALKYRKQNYVVKVLNTVKEIESVFEKNENKLLVVLDDPFGKESFDEKAYKCWKRSEETLKNKSTKLKILLSCRKYIVRDSKVNGLLRDRSYIVDIDDGQNKLEPSEKKEILKAYATGEKQNIFKAYTTNSNLHSHVLEEIVNVEVFFPSLCKLYFTKYKNQPDVLLFCKELVAVYKEEITNFRNSCEKIYCALILLVLFNNDLCVYKLINRENKEKFQHALEICGITNIAPYFFTDIFESLNGLFVQRKEESYEFYNSCVRDITTFVFGLDYPADVIKYADIGFLRRRVKLKGCNDQSDEHTLFIDETLIDDLGNRLTADIFGGNVLDVILNPCLKNKKVTKVLIEKIEHHSEMLLKKIKLQSVKRELFQASNRSFASKLTFIELENEISPMFALIVFCEANVSLDFLRALDQNPDNFQKNSLFSAVCCNGAVDLFEMFSKYDITELLTEKWGNLYPIHILSMFHNFEILRELITKTDVNVNTKSTDDLTPLILAAGHEAEDSKNNAQEKLYETRRDEIIQILLSHGADVNLCTKNGVSPLQIASQKGYDKTVELLLHKGADINKCNKNEVSSLYLACQDGHENTVEILLKRQAKINKCDRDGISPIYVACKNGHNKTVKILLECKADINLCDKSGNSPLNIACKNGHYDTVEMLLLNKRVDIKKCNDKGISSLHRACQNGYFKIVELLLKKGANIDECNENGLSPLHIASQNGHNEIVKLLLKRKAKHDLRTKTGSSPLCLACERGHNATIEHLLSYGAELNICNEKGTSPLFLACENGHSSTVKILLKKEADVNLCMKNGASPLYIACVNGHYSTVEILLDSTAFIKSNLIDGATISKCKTDVASSLFIACQQGHELIAKLLLEKGANFNANIKNGTSPLHIACEKGHDNIVQLLLKAGNDIDLCNKIGASPLFIACQNKRKKTVELLLDKGANVNLYDKSRASPLFIACKRNYDTIVDLLLHHEADINLRDEKGTSPLSIACQCGSDGAVQLLLQARADQNLCADNGASPLYLACENGHDSTVDLLLKYGVDMNLSLKDGANPLFIACQNGHDRIVEKLLCAGTYCNLKNKKGESPLYIACQNGHNVIVQFLISYGADSNSCDKNGISPLNIANQKGHDIIGNTLENISKGVNDLCKNNRTNPLFRACQNGYIQVVHSLLSSKTDIDLSLSNGATPLFIACLNRHNSIVQLLIKHGAEINNSVDKKDKTLQFLLYNEDNILDYMHEPDSFFSLFLFCEAELMIRMTHVSDLF